MRTELLVVLALTVIGASSSARERLLVQFDTGSVTISDTQLLIDLLFVTPEILLVHPASGDVNCSGEISISDVSAIIDFLFISNTPLNCCHSLE